MPAHDRRLAGRSPAYRDTMHWPTWRRLGASPFGVALAGLRVVVTQGVAVRFRRLESSLVWLFVGHWRRPRCGHGSDSAAREPAPASGKTTHERSCAPHVRT